MTATTALTAQNTQGVYDVHAVPPAFLRKQIDANFSDIGVDVVKTGMLASAESISTVAAALKDYNAQTVVVDPVMVATTGAKLLPESALSAMTNELFPLTTLLTPNIPEANALWEHLNMEPPPIYQLVDFQNYVGSLFAVLDCEWLLVKGGHLPFEDSGLVASTPESSDMVVDILYGPRSLAPSPTLFTTQYQFTKHTHGTGCSLASAIACNLAKGLYMTDAVKAAQHYIEVAIRTAPGLGKGNGPLNHFHSTYTMPFSRGRFMEYLIGREDVYDTWANYTQHSFVKAIGDGSLPLDSFKGYLVQDYLFLIQFSRAYALAAYKSKSVKDISAAASTVLNLIQKELTLHVKFCSRWGITQQQLEATEELPACTAYTRYVLDIGQSEDLVALLVALTPCILGYQRIARELHDDRSSQRHGNPYWEWVEMYVGEEYAEAVKKSMDLLEGYAAMQSPSRIDELAKIFIHATKMEVGFWQMFPSSAAQAEARKRLDWGQY